MLPLEIDVLSVKRMLEQQEKFILLDCREADEVATARIEGALHIPMREIPARLAELESADLKSARDGRIVVHCHHGGRSQRVTHFLRQQGFEGAQNMSGGIDAWSEQVDAGVPRYE